MLAYGIAPPILFPGTHLLTSRSTNRTIAITPGQLKSTPWEQTVKICRDYAIRGIETISQLPRGGDGKGPLRFVYISGNNAERDPTKKPLLLGDYCILRVCPVVQLTFIPKPTNLDTDISRSPQGEAESRILEYALQSKGAVEASVAKPGLINGPGKSSPILQRVFLTLIGLPKIQVSEISAALLQQVVGGFEKDTLLNADMVRIGQKVLGAEK